MNEIFPYQGGDPTKKGFYQPFLRVCVCVCLCVSVCVSLGTGVIGWTGA